MVVLVNAEHRALVQRARPDADAWFHWLRHGVQRSDVARYAWLALRGERYSLYLDADLSPTAELVTEVQRRLSSGAHAVVARGPNVGGVSNCILGSRDPRLWYACLDLIAANPRPRGLGRHLDVLLSTGPGLLSRAIRGALPDIRVDVVNFHGTLNRPAICGHVGDDDVGTMVRQLRGTSSWGAEDTLVLNALACHGPAIALAASYLAAAAFILVLVATCTKWNGYQASFGRGPTSLPLCCAKPARSDNPVELM